jgi:hypothetical protein
MAAFQRMFGELGEFLNDLQNQEVTDRMAAFRITV